MEMVGDINLVIPILIAIFTSKMIADHLSKALYKFQLEGKALPYLDSDPKIVVKKRMLALSRDFYLFHKEQIMRRIHGLFYSF